MSSTEETKITRDPEGHLDKMIITRENDETKIVKTYEAEVGILGTPVKGHKVSESRTKKD